MNIKKLEKNSVFRNVSDITKNKHMQRVNIIVNTIEGRFPDVDMAEKIKFKHCKWVLDNFIDEKSKYTKDDYIRSLRAMINALGKSHWCDMLNLNLDPSKGGRPRKIGVRSSKRIF
ncbi:hypothetical protein [Marinobacterium stanieri]|uniref:hypothetical protein n=1 Tax=Marinobacterium stanieri TaxID=49186 RepID=UPI003A92348C